VPDESPRAFYDALASGYDMLFDDWWAGAQWHGSVVDAMLRRNGVAPPARVLDCAAGIGTQSIPLAQLGYRVTATDLSPEAIARAQHEAASRDVRLHAHVADMRTVDDVVTGPFDAVIACDNALPHLLDDTDLDAALGAIRRVVAPGGMFLASVRDYDAIRREHPPGIPAVFRNRSYGRQIAGQAWEWSDDEERIRIHLFTIEERAPGEWHPTVYTTWYRVLTRDTLVGALARAGYDEIVWYDADECGYYQPMVTARVMTR
jgi:glycine/sarcosine N-methyltransferase